MINSVSKPLPFLRPHLPLVSPKRRLPERKPLTIVAGFTNNNGVALAADSQEIISDYAKGTTSKITLLYCGYEWCVGISGAAEETAYLELFQEELARALFALEKYDYDKMIAITKSVLHKLHKQHIWPQRDRKSPFQSLIVTQCVAEPDSPRSLRPRLLETKDSAVVEVDAFKSIGVGTYMAKYLEDRLLKDHDTMNCSVDHLGDILILTLKEIKKAIVGCDGLTTVALFYEDGRSRYMSTAEVQDVEKLSDKLENVSLKLLLALTDPAIPESEFASIAKQASAETDAIIQRREKLIAKRKKILEDLPVYRGKTSTFRGWQG